MLLIKSLNTSLKSSGCSDLRLLCGLLIKTRDTQVKKKKKGQRQTHLAVGKMSITSFKRVYIRLHLLA